MLRFTTLRQYVFCAFLALLTYESAANHILGWTIDYTPKGQDSVELSCQVLSYCGGYNFGGGAASAVDSMPTSLTVIGFCQGQSALDSFILPLDYEEEVSTYCPSQMGALSTCPGNATPMTGLMGFYRSTYRHTVHVNALPTTCDDLTFVTKWSARASSSTYDGNPGVAISANWHRNTFPMNRSARIRNAQPMPMYDDGEEVVVALGAFDPDGDHLEWALDSLWVDWDAASGLESVSYAAGYSELQPMGQSIDLDSSSGTLRFTAHAEGSAPFSHYSIGLIAREYDAKTSAYKGEVRVNLPIIVSASSAPEGGLQLSQGLMVGGMVTDSLSLTLCQEQTVSLELEFTDLDSAGNPSNDSLVFASNIMEVMPGASFSNSSGNPTILTIDYVPSETLAPGVYYVTIWAQNHHCPFQETRSFLLEVTVIGPTNAGPDLTICTGDTVWFDAQFGDTFLWEVIDGTVLQSGVNFGCVTCQKPWAYPDTTTTYRVSSNLSTACGNLDTITVYVDEPQQVSITTLNGGSPGPTKYCANDDQDTLLPSIAGGVFYGDGIIDSIAGIFDPGLLDPGFGNIVIPQINYTLNDVCESEGGLTLIVHGLTDATILSDGLVYDTTSSFDLESVTDGGYWFSESHPSNPDSSGFFQPSLISAPDSFWVVHVVTDTHGCSNSDSLWVTVAQSVGMDERYAQGLTIAPNPAVEQVNVLWEGGPCTIEVVDLSGRVMFTGDLQANRPLYVGDWPVGVYVLRVKVRNGEVIHRKLIRAPR